MSAPLRTSPLTLVIDNPQVLQQGGAPIHTFDRKGGSIGSSGCSWMLHDRAGGVAPTHCEILYQDSGFLVIDRCGQTRLNDQSRPLTRGAIVRLQNADRLHIGPYSLSVHLDGEQHLLPDPTRVLAQHAIEDLLPGSGDPLDGLPLVSAEQGLRFHTLSPDWLAYQSLAEPEQSHGQLDPLRALEHALARSNFDPSDDQKDFLIHNCGSSPPPSQADVSATQLEAVHGRPTPNSGVNPMSEHETCSPAQEWLHAQQVGGTDAANLMRPLLEGLGAPVGALDAHCAHALLIEAGQSLGALIRGLSALREIPSGLHAHAPFNARTLQPFEDNPLRLGLSYPETVRALFSSERSVVHLSPRAAVEESLDQIRRQQQAMLKAVSAGLAALLQAFSPEHLQRRFNRYRPEQTPQDIEDGWAWQMYGHYFNELVSSRQQGFDKLFWEVFEQAFDQALRAEAP